MKRTIVILLFCFLISSLHAQKTSFSKYGDFYAYIDVSAKTGSFGKVVIKTVTENKRMYTIESDKERSDNHRHSFTLPFV